ncbi:MAG: DNA-binding FadR family transcriptional regulator [Bradymonadia bacterium]|jgi:DNA-binding FadR family transcriptional regulator
MSSSPPNTPKATARGTKGRIADELYQVLRRRILSGDLAAGARLLAERDLSAELGTNRNTLREAIKRLEQDHLVTVRHGQGVTVCDFRRTGTIELLEPFLAYGKDPNEKMNALRDLLMFRTQVLEQAMQLAAERASASDHDRLVRITSILSAAFPTGNAKALSQGFEEWLEALIDSAHSLTARWAANPFLEINRTFTGKFPALWITDTAFLQYLQRCVDAIGAKDAAAGMAATRQYYAHIDAVILAAMEAALPFMAGEFIAPNTEGEPHVH